jgi:hypothetical protein
MLQILRITFGVLCLLWLLTSWLFPYEISFNMLALVLFVMFFAQSVDLLKSNHTILGSVTLVVSTMMAFIFIEKFFPIT